MKTTTVRCRVLVPSLSSYLALLVAMTFVACIGPAPDAAPTSIDQGDRQSAGPQLGDPYSANPLLGDQQSGDSQPANPLLGDQQSGDSQPGDPQPGDPQPNDPPMYVVDIRGMSLNMTETMLSFQGIVNRDAPRLYLIRYASDDEWLPRLGSLYGYTFQEITPAEDALELPELFARCHELVVYDDLDSDLAVNNAISAAGIIGAAIVEHSDLQPMLDHGFTIANHQLGDLRGRFAGDHQAQRWGFRHIRPSCSDETYGLSLGHLASRNKGIDTMVQQNMFVWTVDSSARYINDYATTQTNILATYDPMTLAYGWWSKEVVDVHVLSERGHTMLVAGPNNSFLRHMPARELVQNTRAQIPAFDRTKSYVSLFFTQGDSMHFCQRNNLEHWTATALGDPDTLIRDRFPFGLMHTPLQVDLQPSVPAYLYATQSHKQFFVGKGYGYANLTKLHRNGHLAAYIARSRDYLTRLGLPDIMINDRLLECDPTHEVLSIVTGELGPRAVILKHQLDCAETEDDPPMVINDVPVFADPVFNRNRPRDGWIHIDDTVAAIAASASFLLGVSRPHRHRQATRTPGRQDPSRSPRHHSGEPRRHDPHGPSTRGPLAAVARNAATLLLW